MEIKGDNVQHLRRCWRNMGGFCDFFVGRISRQYSPILPHLLCSSSPTKKSGCITLPHLRKFSRPLISQHLTTPCFSIKIDTNEFNESTIMFYTQSETQKCPTPSCEYPARDSKVVFSASCIQQLIVKNLLQHMLQLAYTM